MVSIDLDNIIHYHHAPIPKPPCKPPHLTTSSRGSSHPPFNQPVLIHPLPPRPPCLSRESPQTCHPRRQSPSPAVSCVPRDRDAHLNEFDKELANLEMAEFGSQETPGLCFGGSEETQAEDINDIQRKELHDRHGEPPTATIVLRTIQGSSQRTLLRRKIPPPHQTLPRQTFHQQPVHPLVLWKLMAPVSPNEPCPVQDPTPTERNETQLSAFGCETEVNIVVAGNVSSDQAPSPNPSTPVPAGDEPEPANQRLFRRSPETGAESRKSSPLPVTEAYSIQLDARDLPVTRDSHLEVQSDGNDIHSTDCCPDYEALSSTISPVLQQKKQAVSRSEGKDSPRDISRSCSVSVVVPITRSRGLPITRSTRAGSTRCTGKRKNRAKSACNVESDDPDDSDYTDGNDSGVGDITRLPRLRKRQRRTATTKIQPAQARRESPHCVFSLPGPEEEIASPCPATSLQDIQTIPVRGFLTRQTILSRVIYSCTFQEDRQASCPHGPTKGPAYDKNLDNTRHATQSSSKKQPARATRFLPDEDDRLIELKEQRGLPWSRIVKHFPGRTKGSLQVRYSTRLKDR
ncbi:hypothetical protein N7497_012189 [Penicillium chrysogenum]|nr:hypothetical protein N7497_012189 [Penicillium chrysogenum]